MVSRSTRIKIIFVMLAIFVLFVPFLYPTCQIRKEQLHMSISSTQWIVRPEGGILIVNMTVQNDAPCDANVESVQFRTYRLIFPDNTTQDVDLLDAQAVHATIPAGGKIVTNFAFDHAFSVGPRTVLTKVSIILADGSSLEVFDGPIDTTTAG
jgi:hypothetical protein